MSTDTPSGGADRRIRQVLEHLGIERAHFGARVPGELAPLIDEQSPLVATLTLVDPNRTQAGRLAPLGDRLQVVAGDGGMSGLAAQTLGEAIPAAAMVTLAGHSGAGWSDTVTTHLDPVVGALEAHITRHETASPVTSLALEAHDGEVAEIQYRLRGRGPVLVLLPLQLSANQWEPALDLLAERFTVVVLGGPRLGMVAMLEARAASPGYLRVVRNVLDAVGLEPGQTVLDVGCGTGALDRWLARRTQGANPIVAADLSPYLLREARAFTERAGLSQVIDFHEANAEALPFPDHRFDLAMSHTVMEECDADRMLAEMIRVTRPGGKVAVMVRGVDLPMMWNLPLPPDLKTRVQAPLPSVGEGGCADASLYRRFQAGGLEDVTGFPQYMTITGDEADLWAFYEPQALQSLSEDEIAIWEDAKRRGAAEGTLLFARGHHCAIGITPSA